MMVVFQDGDDDYRELFSYNTQSEVGAAIPRRNDIVWIPHDDHYWRVGDVWWDFRDLIPKIEIVITK